MPDTTATVADLGRQVKAKYPGTYNDLDDAELGRRVKTKYPCDYDDFADVPSAAAKPYVSPRYGPTGPTATEVASDQAAEVLKGIPEAITGIPGAVAQLVKMGWKSLTQPGSSEQQQQL